MMLGVTRADPRGSSMMDWRRSLAVLATLLISLAIGQPLAMTEAPSQRPVSPRISDTNPSSDTGAAERKEVKRLLDEYAKPRLSADQRKQVVEQILQQGEDGPRRLLPVLVRDFKAKHAAYLAQFERAARDAIKSRNKDHGKGEQEVRTL